MAIPLSQILSLVGKLDDTPGSETPRERFRKFLQENVIDVGTLRDYVEECLREPKQQQKNRALQDLVNHMGSFLGFDVVFGRYAGVPDQIGFDGLWRSNELNLVIEVKTSEIFNIKTSVLLNYINELVSEHQIPDGEHALGLYVIGKPDPEIKQLEKSIVAEKQSQRLRIISATSLLTLAELKKEFDMSNAEILTLIRPTTPTIDTLISLIGRLKGQSQSEDILPDSPPVESTTSAASPNYWLTPVTTDDEASADDTIASLVGKEHVYAFSDGTPGRKHLRVNDWICFYSTAKGIVARAQVASEPQHKKHPKVRHPEIYKWVFSLKNVTLHLDDPVIIDAAMRSQLDAFQGRNPDARWSWFVQSNHKLTQHDFDSLIRSS